MAKRKTAVKSTKQYIAFTGYTDNGVANYSDWSHYGPFDTVEGAKQEAVANCCDDEHIHIVEIDLGKTVTKALPVTHRIWD